MTKRVDKTGAKPLSLREYGRRRGVSAQAVSKAVKAGRLSRCVVRVNGRPKITDPAIADAEWDATTDLSKAPGKVKERDTKPANGAATTAKDAKAPSELAVQTAREKHWKAKRAELEYRVKAGEYVRADEARAQAIDKFTVVRTKLLGLASRVRQRMPHIAAADVQVIDDLVRDGLEELADGK